MKILRKIQSFFQPAASASAPDLELIYIFLPESLDPHQRAARYENCLEAELRVSGLGYISGGGSLLSDELPDGTRTIESCGIDVDVTDVSAGRELLRTHLPDLGCPAGTALQFNEGPTRLQDEFDGKMWLIGQPRDRLHPGFGI